MAATVSRRSRSYPTLQRRHYEFIVDMFHSVYADVPEELARRAVAERWANILRHTNQNFQRDKFVNACVEGFK